MSKGPLLLAVECATRRASVALARGDELLAAREAASERHHAQVLLPEIDALLADARVALQEVEAFAVSVGPGAFTSLRIGISTVKGLCFGSARPVAGVSTLACVAHEARTRYPEAVAIAALLDARRGEVYAAEFAEQGSLAPASTRLAEGVYAVPALAGSLSAGCLLAGEIPGPVWEGLRAAGRSDLVLAAERAVPRAVAVAALGAAALERGEAVSAAALAPRYLRGAEAQEARRPAVPVLDTP